MSKLVEPLSFQTKHFERVEEIIRIEKFYTDFSRLGSGKTYAPLYISQKQNLPLFVIAPLTVLDVWKTKAKEYDIKLIESITYDSLRGVKTRQLKHSWLTRSGLDENTEFTPTPQLEKLINDGCIFAVDEAHKLKNRSAQFLACKAITHAVLKSNSKSFFVVISATIFDKTECARQFLELTGIITQHFMFRSRFGSVEYENFGLGEVINRAKKYNEQKTLEILTEFDLNDYRHIETTIQKLIYRLLIEVIQYNIASVMSKSNRDKDLKDSALAKVMGDQFLLPDLWNIVANYVFRENKKNGYFNLLNLEDERQLMIEINELARGVGYFGDPNNIDLTRLGKMSTSLQNIETIKLSIFNRITRLILLIYPKAKGVIFLNYKKNMKELVDKLSEYNPVLVCGETKNRSKLIEKFQTNPKCRVFIGNTSIAQGFEINDQRGDEPRFLLQSPSYKVIDMLQSSGRIFRESTKSSVWNRTVYVNFVSEGKNVFKEKRILDAIAKKSTVLKSIMGNEGQLYPGDFEDEYESKDFLKGIF